MSIVPDPPKTKRLSASEKPKKSQTSLRLSDSQVKMMIKFSTYVSSAQTISTSSFASLILYADDYYGFVYAKKSSSESKTTSTKAPPIARLPSNSSLTTWSYNPSTELVGVLTEYPDASGAATIPWLYELTLLLAIEKVPEITKLELVSQFLTTFDPDEVKKVGHVFREFSRQVLLGISSPQYQPALLHLLRNGTDRLEAHANKSSLQNPTVSTRYYSSGLTPLHSSLMKLASEVSHHAIVAPYLPRNAHQTNSESFFHRYFRPDPQSGTNYATLFIYYFHASKLLFEEKNYLEALEHVTIALAACPWMHSEPVFVHFALTLLVASNLRNISGETKRNNRDVNFKNNSNPIELYSSHISVDQYLNGVYKLQKNNYFTSLYGETASPVEALVGAESKESLHTPALAFLWDVWIKMPKLEGYQLADEVRTLINKHRELYFLNLSEYYISVSGTTLTGTDASRDYLAHVLEPVFPKSTDFKFLSAINEALASEATSTTTTSNISGTATPGQVNSPTRLRINQSTSIVGGTATPTESSSHGQTLEGDVSEFLKSKIERGNGNVGSSKKKSFFVGHSFISPKLSRAQKEELTRDFVYDLVMTRALNATIDEEPVEPSKAALVNGDEDDEDEEMAVDGEPRESYWLTLHHNSAIDRAQGSKLGLDEQLAQLRERLDQVGAVEQLVSEHGAAGIPSQDATVIGAIGGLQAHHQKATRIPSISGVLDENHKEYSSLLENHDSMFTKPLTHGILSRTGNTFMESPDVSEKNGPQALANLAAQKYGSFMRAQLQEYYPKGHEEKEYEHGNEVQSRQTKHKTEKPNAGFGRESSREQSNRHGENFWGASAESGSSKPGGSVAKDTMSLEDILSVDSFEKHEQPENQGSHGTSGVEEDADGDVDLSFYDEEGKGQEEEERKLGVEKTDSDGDVELEGVSDDDEDEEWTPSGRYNAVVKKKMATVEERGSDSDEQMGDDDEYEDEDDDEEESN